MGTLPLPLMEQLTALKVNEVIINRLTAIAFEIDIPLSRKEKDFVPLLFCHALITVIHEALAGRQLPSPV